MIKMIGLCFENSYIKYKNNFYQQTDGCAMGNPLSQLLAAVVVDDIIEQSLNDIAIMKSYGDDLLLSIPEGREQQIFETFNRQNKRIQFTIEEEDGDGRLSFLDMLIIRENDGKILKAD